MQIDSLLISYMESSYLSFAYVRVFISIAKTIVYLSTTIY